MKIAFTGPRPNKLVGYNEANYSEFIPELTALLSQFGDDTEFICGGAQGFDQLAFAAAYALKQTHPNIKVKVYVPFEGQERLWKPTGIFGKDKYREQLQQADEVRYISDVKADAKYGEIVRALFKRNEAMVNDADMVIALYPTDYWRMDTGGTAGCMRYALGKKPLYQLRFKKPNEVLTIDGELALIEEQTTTE